MCHAGCYHTPAYSFSDMVFLPGYLPVLYYITKYLSMKYRELSEEEIVCLIKNGCRADNWNNILVKEGFSAEHISNTYFSGEIKLGCFGSKSSGHGKMVIYSGISNAKLHNCIIDDDVYICGVANCIANYKISQGVHIENVNRIICEGESSFGNGTEVSVLNETGGRDVPIYDRMSAHLAYMLAMYRYRPEMIRNIREMIHGYSSEKKSDMGYIGKYARIYNTSEIMNVHVGEHSVIDGASRLQNGTLVGSVEDHVHVGNNVIAEDFIMCSGANVGDGALLKHVLVGQGSYLSRLFSAHDSLFFANCACENGEAASVFGGPYTVTMHKSSLLIAGMFSFLNAGSGSNQSNHMYKLGPIHQGVIERGSKTTSDSYILWPAKVGAFSLVMGRHVSHPDTSKLPFSYLIENKGRSYIVPGVNLKSVGTIRDAQKWPKRDKRKDKNKLDYVNFNLLSPYTIGRMMEGIKLLDKLEQTSGLTADRYTYQSMTIEPRALRKGRDYYRMAINKFMGNSIIKRLEAVEFDSDNMIREFLNPTIETGRGEWVDMSGLILPKSEVSELVNSIETGKFKSLDEIESFFKMQYDNYYDMEWTWVVEHFEEWYGKRMNDVTSADIISIVELWKKSVVELDNMLYEDAKKEFSLISKIGFGLDGSACRQDSDFEQVRGVFEQDPFVRMVIDHIKIKTALGDELITRMQKI